MLSLASHHDAAEEWEWQTPGIEVKIKRTYYDLGLRRQIGVIRYVHCGTCAVYLFQKKKMVNVENEELMLTVPKVGDRVRIMGTDLDGATGVLKTVNIVDKKNKIGIVSVHGDLKFVPLSLLARVVEVGVS